MDKYREILKAKLNGAADWQLENYKYVIEWNNKCGETVEQIIDICERHNNYQLTILGCSSPLNYLNYLNEFTGKEWEIVASCIGTVFQLKKNKKEK